MKKLIERKFYLGQLKRLKDQHIIKVITGLRRSGKSTLLTMFAQQIINSGVSTSRVHQYNFEKPLFPETHTWRDIYQEIMAKVVTDNMNYIFLDEPQQVPEFERLIDALFVENHIDLYVTGSNAYFLSGDIATLLSGRYITIHVLPFSFAEFVESQEETTATKYELFNRYLNETSLPQGVFLYKQGIDIQNQ